MLFLTVLLFCVGICFPSSKRNYFHSGKLTGESVINNANLPLLSKRPHSATTTSSSSSSSSVSSSGSVSSSVSDSVSGKVISTPPKETAVNDPGSTRFTLSSRPSNNVERTGNEIIFSGPTSHQATLTWDEPPKRVLFLSKPHPDVLEAVERSIPFLVDSGLDLYVEDTLYEGLLERDVHDYQLDGQPVSPQSDAGKVQNFVVRRKVPMRLLNKADPKSDDIDLVIAFGGDGLLMHCNVLFGSCSIPACMCFNFGSLGFLAPFHWEDFEREVTNALEGPVLLTLRMKLECNLWKNGELAGTYHVLNEVVIDRGTSPFLSLIDVEIDRQYLTTVQGDGIILATPTGSTAYSLAAGGSMVHPSVPAILLTPICAHTLSFRPLLLPDSSVLTCSIPSDCRASGWVSFDGKFRQELLKGDRLEVKLSPYPMPTVNRRTFTGDWFDSLRSGFMFNSRPRQKVGTPPPPSVLPLVLPSPCLYSPLPLYSLSYSPCTPPPLYSPPRACTPPSPCTPPPPTVPPSPVLPSLCIPHWPILSYHI